jgi:hypothetical protein
MLKRPMTIRALSRQEFDRFAATQPTVSDFTADAVEWFADDTGLVLGAVTYRKADHPWSFVVLARDTHGQFAPLNLQFGAWNAAEARRLVIARMETAVLNADQAGRPRPAACTSLRDKS